jgi:xylitol oxidase
MAEKMKNWAGNVTFGAERFHRPSSLSEVQRLVADSGRVRVLGSGHSFNRLADTPGDLVSLAGLPRLIEVDTARASATASAGLRYGELARELYKAGRALRNLGSLTHISVAGSCATGTHGSGDANGCLATAVSALEMITADGDVVTANRDSDPERFPGMVVALGALGVITRLTLDTVPSFDMRQYVYENLPLAQVVEHFGDITGGAYSVSLFTDWRGRHIRQAWLKHRADVHWEAEPEWMGGRLADGERHMVRGLSAESCTQQLGVPGPWHERLPHFRLEFTPSTGEELQSEYLLPRTSALDALAALQSIADRLAPVVQISEIRTVAADDLWLSPAYQRDSVAIHFTWVRDWAAVAPVLADVERCLAPMHARPHWGKLFRTNPDVLARLYPKLNDFTRLMVDFDPDGKFDNELLYRLFRSAGARVRRDKPS